LRLLEESLVLTCPNPKCGRQFKESIVLTINSVEPPKKYDACPFCFASLETESLVDQEINAEQEIQKVVAQESNFENETLEFEESESSDESGQEKIKDSGSGFFSKVKSLIPGSSPKKEQKQKVEESESDLEILIEKEDQIEDKLKIKPPVKNENQKQIESTSKQDVTSGCPQTFGYLANRPKDETIPQVCFVCPRMVDCMLSPRDN
jgi:hypothetical protein